MLVKRGPSQVQVETFHTLLAALDNKATRKKVPTKQAETRPSKTCPDIMGAGQVTASGGPLPANFGPKQKHNRCNNLQATNRPSMHAHIT